MDVAPCIEFRLRFYISVLWNCIPYLEQEVVAKDYACGVPNQLGRFCRPNRPFLAKNHHLDEN
jgi:hypothetical protein